MQSLWYIAFAILCSLSFHCCVVSIKCNETQYEWPVKEPKFCCNMCPPGELMVRRKDDTCEIECTPCTGDRYNEYNNVYMSCNVCKTCKKSNMEYKSRCNATHNAVCRCKAGYRCEDQSCTQCVPVPNTTKPTLPPLITIKMEYKSCCNATHNNVCRCKAGYRIKAQSCTQSTTPETTTQFIRPKPIRDSVWFLVIIALLCTGIALTLATKIKPFLQWIRTKHGYLLGRKAPPVSLCTEGEEVSKPVQEVCGKCDQPLDV